MMILGILKKNSKKYFLADKNVHTASNGLIKVRERPSKFSIDVRLVNDCADTTMTTRTSTAKFEGFSPN